MSNRICEKNEKYIRESKSNIKENTRRDKKASK